VLDDANLTVAWERTTCAPWGLFGGKAAEVGSVTVHSPESDPIFITKVTQTPVRKGTCVTFLTAGGGGAGDPFDRPAGDVARDVEMGYVSVERALQDYGVAVSTRGEVDEHATERRRKARPAVKGE
jgi:N-methylhydantoinase B